jgi:glycosyltransferase involved in cell wall biosynthesis
MAAGRAVHVVALWRGSAVAWHNDLRVPADRITVIPNGRSASEFHPPSAEERRAAREALDIGCDDRVAIYLGSLSPEKRVDRAIHAVAKLPDVTLIVAGHGPEMPRLRAMAAPLGAQVRFLGRVERPQPVLAAGDLLVLPSDTEGQPGVAIEAGLSGLPVVATAVGGVPEVVAHGRTGLLVDPNDAAGLTAAIRAALVRRKEMGNAARAYCSGRFDLDQVAIRWRNLIDAVLSSPTRSSGGRPLA